MSKPKLTICIVSKSEICSYTVVSLLATLNSQKLKEFFKIDVKMSIGQSDLPKARSIQLTEWFENAKQDELFLFLDADQTFLADDILSSYLYISQGNDVVCGAYAKKSGGMTVQPEFIVDFYRAKKGPLIYGSTGFMMITYEIVEKLSKRLRQLTLSETSKAYPFFYERVVDEEKYGVKDCWLSEDYSFCWLVRQISGKVYGYISPTIGHILPYIKLYSTPVIKDWPKNSIVVYCHTSPTPWSPLSLEKGLGGSETAIIKLTPYWVKAGFAVTVFCKCDKPGIYEGVQYRDKSNFNTNDNYDILIVWRDLRVFATNDLRARIKMVDLHDDVKDDYINDRLINTVDYFMVKSKYQGKVFKDVDEKKIKVIPNGGALKHDKTIQKDKNYIIYSSSYDRGLIYMLKYAWSKIKSECPDAYLKIFYGWNTFDLYHQNEKREFKNLMTELMCQDGVEECGRISQEELALEKSKANIHWYVGDFQEIDCISVRESASVGAIPVVADFAEVFREKEYCIKISGNPTEKDCQLAGAEEIIKLLRDEKYCEKIREEVLSYIPNETWESTANKWIEVFGDK
jgi:hypothetical protein